MDDRLRRLAAGQDNIVARWQLMRKGWSRHRVAHEAAARGWCRIHDGVYVLTPAPLTQRQRWIAAVLTAPGTYLHSWSACFCHGFIEWNGAYETVVRPGNGGRRRYPGLLVARSRTLDGHTTRTDGIPLVTAERALIDVAPALDRLRLGRGFRESIRLRTTTANKIARALDGQRGTGALRELCDRYATIPYHRCRSDAESLALEVLHDAGITLPAVNERVAGREADLVWRQRKLIIEIDGRQFHQFTDQDAEKEARWRAARYTVRRIPSDDVYYRPQRLVALVNVHMYRQ